MPWIWQNSRGYQRRNSRQYSRRRRRSMMEAANDLGPYEDDYSGDFDGFYDRDGNRVSLVIQTPADKLPPTRSANMFDETGRPYPTRARF